MTCTLIWEGSKNVPQTSPATWFPLFMSTNPGSKQSRKFSASLLQLIGFVTVLASFVSRTVLAVKPACKKYDLWPILLRYSRWTSSFACAYLCNSDPVLYKLSLLLWNYLSNHSDWLCSTKDIRSHLLQDTVEQLPHFWWFLDQSILFYPDLQVDSYL